jgi:hypothetical protein
MLDEINEINDVIDIEPIEENDNVQIGDMLVDRTQEC